VRGCAVADIDSWLDVVESALPTAATVSAFIGVIEEFVRARMTRRRRPERSVAWIGV
jgi:hypothetical protein